MPDGWKAHTSAHHDSKSKNSEKEEELQAFRARPVAKTVIYGGGRAGVPKVPKRPTTTPFSGSGGGGSGVGEGVLEDDTIDRFLRQDVLPVFDGITLVVVFPC